MTVTASHTAATGTYVPFYIPHLTGREETYLREAFETGQLDSDGTFTERAVALLRRLTGTPHALLTPSCTHALEIAALALDLQPGDEVIVPSWTFAPTASAFALRGAVPVFVDCRPDTLNLDERRLEEAVSERTRAILVMHYAGVACAMDEITAIAGRHGLPIVEDNAHGLAGAYRGRALGTFGIMAAHSFHATKNIQCSKGGALFVNDPALYERTVLIRDRGTNRYQYFRGEVDKYRWVDLGSSYLLSEPLAAFLTAQLEELPRIQRRRREIWAAYHERLAGWAGRTGVVRPTVPPGCEQPAHIYYLVLPGPDSQQALLAHLAEHGVKATPHFQPLHSSPAGLRYGRTAPGSCPVTEWVADRLIRLPLYADMTDSQVDRVVDALTSFQPRPARRPAPGHDDRKEMR
ncbi:dTDP-4-amino-4,6-dideoxygalactose transaminase [Thermomonospora echinospora]|uniref:dTDP-4-amino-4,6-dideoxygalactose transaminase n=1 Tax=Thermomonospora echinospora TaxID=1992 RepID=A0A1H6DDS7_9ACTN|nr:dTDP-4-amino-4,6-dideoxygalactose transaminase [Thermomonospora echinospora]SEG83607.1 dTDP-4-amino-4,6-dideoxygalactose transaminase [Thermomonospora echinospora]